MKICGKHFYRINVQGVVDGENKNDNCMINTTLAITIHGEKIMNETSQSYCQDESSGSGEYRVERYRASNFIFYEVDIEYESLYTITIKVNDYKGSNLRSSISIKQDPTPINEEPDDQSMDFLDYVGVLAEVSFGRVFLSIILIAITQVIYFFHQLIRKR